MSDDIDIGATVDTIASELGITGNDEGGNDESPEVDETVQTEAAAPAADKLSDAKSAKGTAPAAAADPSKPASDPASAPPRAAPKAWAKEQHERWGKLDKETQDYIEHRERQMLDGLTSYSEGAKSWKALNEVTAPYADLIRSQGLDIPRATQFLLEAHRQLSQGGDAGQAYLVKVAKSYGLDLAKAASLVTANADEPASVKELRERTERLERERHEEMSQRHHAARTQVAKTVTSFADEKNEKGEPKHPYFDECAEDIVALINAGHTLEAAYEKAVFANPVTRAKELARLQTESDAALRAKAKAEAEAAKRGSKTNVNSKDTRRAPTAPSTGKWEDTLAETYQEIKQRQAH